MRFVLAIMIAVVTFALVAGVQSRLERAVTESPAARDNAARAEAARYRLRLTTTFDAGRDPFALEDGGGEPVRMLVRSGTAVLYRRTADLRRGEPVEVAGLAFPGERVELFVLATPSDDERAREAGIRIELFREDGVLCDERTLWAEAGGGVLSERVVLSLHPGGGRPAAGEGGEPDA